MAVYVDDMEAPFGGMVMCHMIADTTEELRAMVQKIGVEWKWVQEPALPGEHFDISKAKRALAVQHGAQEITMRDAARMIRARRRAANEARDTHFSASEDVMTGKAVTPWDERFAAMAEAYAGEEHVGGDFLSTRGGVLTFQDEPLPGNQMVVVILDVVTERTFYADKFDASAERNDPPICYAFGRMDGTEDLDELGPHISMQSDLSYFKPQNDLCKTCPHNEWGSSDTGRGKACSERRRMALLPAGYYQPKRGSRDMELHLYDEIEHYQNADIAYLKLPVTSVKDWARYVTDLASRLRRPPMGVISRVYLEPDPKSQFRVKFDMLEELPEELYETIMQRHEEAKNGIIFPYRAPTGEREAAPARRGVRR